LFTNSINDISIHFKIMMNDKVTNSHHILPWYFRIVGEQLMFSYLIKVLDTFANSR
jgi:hypothetical protein